MREMRDFGEVGAVEERRREERKQEVRGEGE